MKARAPRNRTITLSSLEAERYSERLLTLNGPAELASLVNRTVCQDAMVALPLLPEGFADLVIVDPPYNKDKTFNGKAFSRVSAREYEAWVEKWLGQIRRVLSPRGSLYICSDWESSSVIQRVASRHFSVRNRITWEREKGRGAKANWKNGSEDIWYCTASDRYIFNVDAVKLKRKVIAPYRHADGRPKDWDQTESGGFRLTHPSNIWTDLTVPFWSMPENTDHPTQKPEKLIAKLILASSNPDDTIFDPFAGVGTTAVVAKKLGRQYVSIELDRFYCCIAEHRLRMAEQHSEIQGYEGGVFLERNTVLSTKATSRDRQEGLLSLFEVREER